MPKLSSFAGQSLLHAQGGFEPQRASNCALIIPNVGNDELLVLSLKSVDLPALAIERQSIKYFNQSTHYAGAIAPVENMSIEYRDYIDRDVLSILAKWFQKVACPRTGAIGFAKDYKREGSLFLLPPGMPASDCPGVVESQDYKSRTWKVKGVFPVSLKYPPLDHDSAGEPVAITLDLSVDLCYPASLDS